MKFRVDVLNRAIEDIQKGVDYYNSEKSGLGNDFYDEVDALIYDIAKSPLYQIRYKDIRCLPLKRFPFMIHFSVDEKIKVVKVHAIVNTSRNPIEHWAK